MSNSAINLLFVFVVSKHEHIKLLKLFISTVETALQLDKNSHW
jgi:hypothetical protein